MFSKAELRQVIAQGSLLRPPRPHSPEIYIANWHGQRVVLKTYQHSSLLYRHLVGRLAISREWWALSLLAGSGFAPQPLAKPNPWSIVMEFIEGTPLEKIAPSALSAQKLSLAKLLEQAQGLLYSLEQAGIAHGDLGHDFWSAYGREANLIVKASGGLVAIDFAGAWNLRAPWPLKQLGIAMRAHDRLLPTKILYHLGQNCFPEHPAWSYPVKRSLAWWELMKLLGKI